MCVVIAAGSQLPHVTLLPGDDVEDGGDQEEGAQPEAVHPGGEPLPARVRQAVQQCHAHEGRHHQELRCENSNNNLQHRHDNTQVTRKRSGGWSLTAWV